MEDNSNLAVLVDAKKEYTNHLIDALRSGIITGLKALYDDADEACKHDNTPKEVIMEFQRNLERVPKWSQDVINKELKRIGKEADWNDNLSDLITATFITHTKVLAVLNKNNKKRIELKVPKSNHFIHLCYIESARKLWKAPYLFCVRGNNKIEQCRNIEETDNIIKVAIEETIRKLLPVKAILREYFDDEAEEEEPNVEDEDVKLSMTPRQKTNILRLVKKELENTNGNIDVNNESDIRKLIQEELRKVSSSNSKPNKLVEEQPTSEVLEEIVEKVKKLQEPHTSTDTEQKETVVSDTTIEIPNNTEEEHITNTDEVATTSNEPPTTSNNTPVNSPTDIPVDTPAEDDYDDDFIVDDVDIGRVSENETDDETSEVPLHTEEDLQKLLEDSDMEASSINIDEPKKQNIPIRPMEDIELDSDFELDSDVEMDTFEENSEVSKDSEFSFF